MEITLSTYTFSYKCHDYLKFLLESLKYQLDPVSDPKCFNLRNMFIHIKAHFTSSEETSHFFVCVYMYVHILMLLFLSKYKCAHAHTRLLADSLLNEVGVFAKNKKCFILTSKIFRYVKAFTLIVNKSNPSLFYNEQKMLSKCNLYPTYLLF